MIVCVYENEDNEFTFVTNGCGCCSYNYNFNKANDNNSDKEEIIEEVKRTIEVAKNACDVLGLNINDFL